MLERGISCASLMITILRVGFMFFLKKSDALECFKTYMKLVENEAKTFIKFLWLERGGEFNFQFQIIL